MFAIVIGLLATKFGGDPFQDDFTIELQYITAAT